MRRNDLLGLAVVTGARGREFGIDIFPRNVFLFQLIFYNKGHHSLTSISERTKYTLYNG